MRSHSSPVTSRKRVGEVMPALLTSAPTGGHGAVDDGERGLDRGLVGDVAADADGLHAVALGDLVGGVLGAGLVEVEDGDVPAGGGQGVGGGAADAALGAGAGDDGGLVRDGHGASPVLEAAVSDGGRASGRRRGSAVRAGSSALTLLTIGVGGQAVAVVQGGQGAGGEELVGQRDRDDRGCRPRRRRAVEATDSASPPMTVWFSSVTTSRSVRGRAQDRLAVQRLDRRARAARRRRRGRPRAGRRPAAPAWSSGRWR